MTVAFALSLTLTPGRFGDQATTAPFLLSSGLNLAGVILMALAAAGLYAAHRDAAGRFGVAGFAGALFACMIAAGGYWALLFVYPYVAVPTTVDGSHHEVVGHAGITSTLSAVYVQSPCYRPESGVRVASRTSATAADGARHADERMSDHGLELSGAGLRTSAHTSACVRSWRGVTARIW